MGGGMSLVKLLVLLFVTCAYVCGLCMYVPSCLHVCASGAQSLIASVLSLIALYLVYRGVVSHLYPEFADVGQST